MDAHRVRRRRWIIPVAALVVAAAVAAAAVLVLKDEGEDSDESFSLAVAQPAYATSGPKVLVDEAHHNFHTIGGRYQPFATLLRNDGYEVSANFVIFSRESLQGQNVLVVAGALHNNLRAPQPGRPAFSDAEADAVRDWVREGGSLLLVTDHPPFGAANEILVSRFGIESSKSYLRDKANAEVTQGGNDGWLVFSRANGLLRAHAITEGRAPAERLNSVETFSGQSLKGPAESTSILATADSARDHPPKLADPVKSAAGRSAALALPFGKGRVVVLGEAAMLSIQKTDKGVQFGMHRPGNDNRQFALNIMHWLSGLLDPVTPQ